MKRYSPFYFIGQAFQGLWRNSVMSIASIAVLLSCLVVMGGFALLVKNIDFNLEKIGLLNEIVVFLEEDVTEEDISRIDAEINSLENVAKVEFISKERALQEFMEEYSEYGEILEEADELSNPLPDSFVITYQDNSKVTTLQYHLTHMEGIEKVKSRQDLSATIENFKSGVTLIFSWFLIILFIVSIFVIINTVKLAVFARRDEISIMRYIGASRWFIFTPFILEGVIIGLVSSAIAFFIEGYIYSYVEKMVITDIKMIEIIPYDNLSTPVLLGFIGIGVLTGIVGSSISLRRYIEV
ncbi:MAG: ABC transporter permease [Clostridiales bacterium]|nr:ABC transporter permease [Clostridiales bacterium]